MAKKPADIKAVLAKASFKVFQNVRKDGQTTAEVLELKGMEQGAGDWRKCLFPKPAFKDILHKAGQLRMMHYDLTLPWEAGYRLCPAKAHANYDAKMSAGIKGVYAAVSVMLSQYDEWIRQAQKMHGKNFIPELYPDKTHMKSYFTFAVEYAPVPRAADFAVSGIAAEAVDAMREQFEKTKAEQIETAMKDVWNRLLIPVDKIANKLSGKETIFRKSIVEDVREMLSLLPSLNLTNDPALSTLADEIQKKFADIDTEAVKTNAAVRQEASAAAKAIIARFGAIGKRRFA